MISAYEELGKEKGWTRADAESEVVRYLQRRAIAAEGSLDGDGQDNATFGLLAFAIALALYGAGRARASARLPDGVHDRRRRLVSDFRLYCGMREVAVASHDLEKNI